jgi:hypothetical protein
MRLEATKAQTSHRPLLWISLLLTVGLVYWQWSAEQDAEDEVVVADASIASPRARTNTQAMLAQPAPVDSEVKSVKVAMQQPVAPSAKPTDIATWMQRKLPATKVSHALFAAHEWLPPPPKPQPPPLPQAPPVPYTYVGSMDDLPDGHTVILMQQKKILMPKPGSQMTPQWRLDREDEQSVYFTYLPLDKTVVLSKAKTSAAGQRQAAAEFEDNIPLEQ